MARVKKLNIKVRYVGTDLVVNDLGEGKSPRFELYDTKNKKVLKKSNNPLEFEKIVWPSVDK